MGAQSLTYEDWMRAVDSQFQRKLGLGTADLSDWGYRDAYDDGMSPARAAAAAMRGVADAHNAALGDAQKDIEKLTAQLAVAKSALERAKLVITTMGAHYVMSDVSPGLEVRAIDAVLASLNATNAEKEAK